MNLNTYASLDFVNFVGGQDEYDALEKFVHQKPDENALASHVAIHNFNSINTNTSSMLVLMWPNPSKGYGAQVLSEVQHEIRMRCAAQKPPVSLIGHSTDSAGFSLQYAVNIMTLVLSRRVLYILA